MSDRPLRVAKASAATDLHWLLRYARHCGFSGGVQPAGGPADLREEAATCSRHGGQTGHDALVQALRRAFGPPAWRLVCRSPRECFLPILRNRELSLHSLIAYCQRLAARSFVVAPQATLLAYFVTQRRRFFNHPCRVPEDDDYTLMRVADRERHLRVRDIALVANWVQQVRFDVRLNHRWTALLRRAVLFRAQERIDLQLRKLPGWHFFCRTTDWRGYRVEPLTDPAALWEEGQQLGHCAFRLRTLCRASKPSRFFSVSRGGRRLATLELGWRPPEPADIGMDREWGRWELADLRLSFNRLPEAALVEAMTAFAWQYNFWAKRLGRMPPGYLEELRERIRLSGGHVTWSPWAAGSVAAA